MTVVACNCSRMQLAWSKCVLFFVLCVGNTLTQPFFFFLSFSHSQNVYPEYLGNLFLINAPLIFRGMWVLIRSWMETKTAAKFHVLGGDYLPTLLQYIDVEELPVEYGKMVVLCVCVWGGYALES